MKRNRLLPGFGALLLTAWVLMEPVAEARRLHDRLSPIADPYSESNAIRGALGYLEHGLGVHAGLPETTFGGLYPESGDLSQFSAYVDTHYPPGAVWLAAVMKRACGPRPISCLRSLPLSACAIGAVVLALGLTAALGLVRGLAVAFAAFAIPLYSNMMLGLHYQGYALALLSIQLGALLLLYADGRPPGARDLALACGLGFLQGWLSFDYFFLVALAPLPVAVLFSDLRERESRRRLLRLVLVSGAGFAIAHALHFVQVVAYYGELPAAVRDLLGSAAERFDPVRSPEFHGEPPPPWAFDPWMVSNVFLFMLSEGETFFRFSLGNAVLPALAFLLLLRGARLALPIKGWRLCVEASSRPVWAIAAALFVSCAWMSLMRGHAASHAHFIPRHLFLVWLVTLVALLRSVRLERAQPAVSGAGSS